MFSFLKVSELWRQKSSEPLENGDHSPYLIKKFFFRVRVQGKTVVLRDKSVKSQIKKEEFNCQKKCEKKSNLEKFGPKTKKMSVTSKSLSSQIHVG